MFVAGYPLADSLVLELARLVGDDPLAERLEYAYSSDTKVLGLSVRERELLLRTLDDPPLGLEELRAVLLNERVGRMRDGLV